MVYLYIIYICSLHYSASSTCSSFPSCLSFLTFFSITVPCSPLYLYEEAATRLPCVWYWFFKRLILLTTCSPANIDSPWKLLILPLLCKRDLKAKQCIVFFSISHGSSDTLIFLICRYGWNKDENKAMYDSSPVLTVRRVSSLKAWCVLP